MTERPTLPRQDDTGGRRDSDPRKRYEAPRLIDYGRITKLTRTGGITTKDTGSMNRQGP